MTTQITAVLIAIILLLTTMLNIRCIFILILQVDKLRLRKVKLHDQQCTINKL